MKQILFPSKLKGRITIPASKSDGQRALLAAALSYGSSTISGLGKSADELAVLDAIQKMGSKITFLETDVIQIEGIKNLTENCKVSSHESGLGFRLLVGALSSFEGEKIIEASGSLLKRTMEIYEHTLPEMGIVVESNNGFPPLKIKGKLKSGKYVVDGSLSSQFISGLLFGFSKLNEQSELYVKDLVSRPYVEMTINTLKSFGARIVEHENSKFVIEASQLTASNYSVEADWSSASYWLVASALNQELECFNLKMDSKQADKSLLAVFNLANCKIERSEGIKIDGSQRRPFEFDATDCPDLFPALVVFAAGIEGVSKVKGIHRLEHKESNRALSLQSEFGKIGLKIDFEEDWMLIHGTGKLSGGKVHSHNDHRIAMSLAIASCISSSEIEIDGAEAVAKSYPSFWEDFSFLS